MLINVAEDQDVTFVTLVRRFDASSAIEVEPELDSVLSSGKKKVLFDCSGTEYIASAGLRVLLAVSRTVLRNGGAVGLFGLSPSVKRVFDIGGFSRIFPIYPDRTTALAAIRG